MKIAYIASDFGLVSETFVQDLAIGLAEAGQTVKIFCNQATATRVDSLPLHVVRFLGVSSLLDRVGLRVDRLLGQQGEARTYQRYLSHAHRQLRPALRQYQPDVAYIDYGTVAALARSVLQELNIPFVVHFHGADITSALNNPAYRQALQQVFQTASALIVASDHVRRLLILEGAPAAKIHVVRLGVNLSGLQPLPWSERKRLPPSIVFLGRLTPKKHPIALLEAFALVKQQVPDAHLSIIGDGPELTRVQQRISSLDLSDAVTLYGALPRAEALAIVNRHWVFAQHSVTAPSGDQEGFGISLAEAAALELPIVSTLHNGIPEQVVDGKTGFLVREFDYEAMADYLAKLLFNPDSAEMIGKAGREKICELCKSKQRVQQIKELIQMKTVNEDPNSETATKKM